MFPRSVALILLFAVTLHVRQTTAQPYASSVVGTDFDFITAADPSAFESLKFLKQGRAEMPDKRAENAALFQQAYIFQAKFNDKTSVKIYVHVDCGTRTAAEVEAKRYVHPLGKLPAVLRQGVKRVVVHHGGKNTTAFSDIGLIVVYAANASLRISTHDLEETIFHESVHAAWDANHAKSAGWIRAQRADGGFATVYAKSKPSREDLAESALFAYTLLNHPERLPASDREKLRQAIPHRIAYIGQLLASGSVNDKPKVAKPATTSGANNPTRPNVILILADDLAPGDLAGVDGNPTRTPFLDRFAKESVSFTQAYSGSCVCAAARAALLTGRYPHRTGVVTLNMNKYPQLTRLRTDETTLADVMKSAGYATGLVGKWHTGRGQGYHPLDRGFDEFQGFDGSMDVGYFKYPLSQQRKVAVVEDQYLTDDLTTRAISFVEKHKDHPFFLHLAHYAPHRPLEAPAKIIARYRQQGFNESVATIYAMIEVMDRGIGQLLRTLGRLKLSDNTIVVFASDNGPDPLTGERFNQGLRGTKYQVNEGGVRVPLFIRWPQQLAPGKRSHSVSFVDLMPTLMELCGINTPLQNPLDGGSFAPVLQDSGAKFSHSRFWQWNRGEPNFTHNAAVRENDFKLVRPFVTRGVRLKESKLSPALYDLAHDPTESRDVARHHPAVAARLSDKLQQWCVQVEADRTRPVKQRPNIALILVDDLGWSDVGSYGHEYHRTPNIDGLARQGMRMTQGYAPAPICSASRASILTGKTPARLGFEFVTKNKAGYQPLDVAVPLKTPAYTLNLPVEERTIADYLMPLGYNTAFFGKWHVSQHYKERYLAWHPGFGPRTQGFQTAVEDFGDHPYAWRGKRRGPDLPEGVFPQDSMVQRTDKFIRNQQGKQKPWFVMASSFYVHTPIKNRCRWLVKDYAKHLTGQAPNREKRLEYAAFVETLDHHVGTILKAIDESGQRENTLVVLMSDNGGHPEYCANAPLRGSKWHLYEGGIRVPVIVRWPGKIEAGTTCDAPVTGYDLLPTFVDIASDKTSMQLPGVDGVSFRPAFANTKWRLERSLIWHFPYYHPEATFSKARKTTGVNDFQTSQTTPQSAIRNGSYKLLHFAEDDRVELYDLSKDIAERNDLSKAQPQVAKRLQTLLEKQLNAMNARRATERQ